ncbi:MAG: hypothetical protein ACJAZO_002385 [Myxococcota bacterium]|jgi:hypothetical protein
MRKIFSHVLAGCSCQTAGDFIGFSSLLPPLRMKIWRRVKDFSSENYFARD